MDVWANPYHGVRMDALVFSTTFGTCSIEWHSDGLTGFGLLATPRATPRISAPDRIAAVIERVQRHLDGDLQDFADLPFDYSRVSEFQRTVYEAALTVKAGTTRTYGWLATAAGRPISSSRAVGMALGRNPWPLLIPCHRFVGANGKLTGFSAPGGVETKRRLLSLERAELFAV